jgi:hypothetical protein
MQAWDSKLLSNIAVIDKSHMANKRLHEVGNFMFLYS